MAKSVLFTCCALALSTLWAKRESIRRTLRPTPEERAENEVRAEVQAAYKIASPTGAGEVRFV